jgi:exopolysaccharide production protein ExoQ
MSQTIATIAYVLLIGGLFALDRDRNVRTSPALWIPVVWLFLSGSRAASQWLVIFGFPGAAVQSDSADYYLDGSPVDRNILFCILAAGVVVLVSRRKQVGTLLQENKLLLLFFLYCGLSVLWSDYTFVAFKRWIKSTGDLVLISIVLTEPNLEGALRRVFARTSFLLVPLSVLFIKYYPDLGREYNRWTWLPAYSGVTQTKNELGMLCLIFGLGSVWRLICLSQSREEKHRVRRMLAHVVIVGMVFWLFWMANSMTSLSCFIMAAAVMVAVSFHRVARRPATVHLLVASVICTSFYALFVNTGSGLVESLGRDPTLTGRTGIWDAVLSVSRSPLVGTGFESFWLGWRLHRVWELTMQGLQEAHNGYLEVYLNLGWIGVIFIAALIATGYRNIFANLRRDHVTVGLRLAFFIVAIVYNFTEAGFRETTLIWIFFLLATCAVPKTNTSKAQNRFEVDTPIKLAKFDSQVDQVLGEELHPHFQIGARRSHSRSLFEAL